jgi:molecular chaperone DnaK
MSSPILGIDFGTTNTAGAFFDDTGRLRLVKVTDRSNVLPSVVWFPAADKTVIGHSARSQVFEDPSHTVFESKRFLGRRFQSSFVAQNRERFAFDISEGADGYCSVQPHGQPLPLTEIAFLVLQQLATLARHTAGGQPFTECVLTVPAHASFRQRDALRQAAQKAGMAVRAVVNEPTAAALYYANLRNPQQTVLIFDLGGGTFDATLMSVENRMVKVLATGGDAFLGGANFDAALAEALVQSFAQRHGIDLRSDRVVMQRLAFAAESAKIALSTMEQAQVRLPCVARDAAGNFLDLEQTLTRAQFEELCFQLIERTTATCDDVLSRARLTANQVDELVLVGGQTRMPAIRRRMAHFKRFSSEKEIHPELGVAVGAALLGRNLKRGATGLADVAPMTISAMLPGGVTLEVIPANTPVPCRKRVTLEGLPPWQAPIPVAIFESLDATSLDRELFGTVPIGPEWRVGTGGNPSLELELGQDFVLKAKLIAANGRSEPIAINETQPMGRI